MATIVQNNSQTKSNLMTSGTRKDKYKLYLLIREDSYDIETNSSEVYTELWIQGVNNTTTFYGYKMTGNILLDKKVLFKDDATATSSKPVSNANPYVLAKGTKTFEHDSLGNLTLTLTGTYASEAPHASSASVETTLTLTKIPRASTILALDADIESATNITINKMNPNFTTTINYTFGDLSGNIVEKTSSDVYGWLVPKKFYGEIPDAPNGIVTLEAITYNDNTEIGRKETTFKVTANEEKSKPTGTLSVIDVKTLTKNLTGNANVIVKNVSNAKVSFTVKSNNSATIKSIALNGKSLSTSSSNYTINNVTTNIFNLVITDSRGYQNTISVEKDFVDYIPLTLKGTIKRNTPTDGKVVVNVSGNFFNKSFGNVYNNLTVYYAYKKHDESSYSSWKSLKITAPTGDTFEDTITLSEAFDYREVFDFKLKANDAVYTGTEVTVSQSISQGIPIYWWNRSTFNVEGDLYVKDELITPQKLPVGSLHLSINNTNPSETLGYGTWELYAKGKTIVGYDENDEDFNVVGKIGGSKDLQKHSHSLKDVKTNTTTLTGKLGDVFSGADDNSSGIVKGKTINSHRQYTSSSQTINNWSVWNLDASHNHTLSGNTSDTGTGTSGNLQPYIVVYIWLRTE